MAKKAKQVEATQVEQLVETQVEAYQMEELQAGETSAAETSVEETKPKARGIGKFIIEQCLETSKSNKEILEDVLAKFEGAKTTMACIAWYKTKLRKEGKIAAKVKAAVTVLEEQATA
jgi:hypothetical protein